MATKCTICDGNSDGYHFGIAACRACSSFFRRTLAENKEYKCRKVGQCNVSQNYRNVCRACRLQKCYQMGMKRQAVESLKSKTDELQVTSSPDTPSTSESCNNVTIESSNYLKGFEAIWKTFVSSLKSLYTVDNPSNIFSEVRLQAVEYKLITKSEYDKLEKAAISIIFSQFLEYIPPFIRASHDDRINILRSTTRGISMLFKAMMTSHIFPENDGRLVMACGYYADTNHLGYFFENSEGHENASKLVLPIITKVKKLSRDIKSYRDVDMGAVVVLFLSQKMRQLGISTDEDEAYWKDVMVEIHAEHVKTFGMAAGGLKFAELLLNLFQLSNLVNDMNESITMVRIFCPDNLMDVWDNIYTTTN